MIVHKLKTWPTCFADILRGKKEFDLRKMDRDFKVGDVLVLSEFVPAIQDFTGRTVKKRVKYILSSKDVPRGFGLQEGFCIMGLEAMG